MYELRDVYTTHSFSLTMTVKINDDKVDASDAQSRCGFFFGAITDGGEYGVCYADSDIRVLEGMAVPFSTTNKSTYRVDLLPGVVAKDTVKGHEDIQAMTQSPSPNIKGLPAALRF